MRLFNEKKAQEGGFEIVLVSLMIIAVLIITLVIAQFLDFFSEDRKIIIEKSQSSEDKLLLMNYLRSNVISNKKEIQMFQLLTTENEKEIEIGTKKIFNRYCQKETTAFEKNRCFWDLSITYNNKNKELRYSGGAAVISLNNPINSSIKIKNMNNEDITISLMRYETG